MADSIPTAVKAGWARALLVRDEASAVIEMALSLPILCTLLFCFMELCLAVYSIDLISELACEGTRYAMVRGAACPNTTSPTCEVSATQVNNYVSGIALPNLAAGTITVNTTYPDGNEAVGSRVRVQVTYVFPISMPFVPKASHTFSTTSQMYIIQ
jgi:hypothetical protein